MMVVLQGSVDNRNTSQLTDNQIMLHSALPFWALALGGGGRLIYKSDWDRVPALCFDHLMGRRKTEQMLLVQCQRVLLEIWEGVLGPGREQSQDPRDGIWPKPWGTRKKPTPWRGSHSLHGLAEIGAYQHTQAQRCVFSSCRGSQIHSTSTSSLMLNPRLVPCTNQYVWAITMFQA